MKNKGYLLLVEDNELIQANNKKMLERQGYSVRLAFTITQAWAIIAKLPPAAIILDIGLPDGNGLDFLRELRRTSNIPVLLLTAMGTPKDIVAGLEAGGDDYLPKPYDKNVFLSRVEALLRRASVVPDRLVAGSLRLEPASGKAYIDGEDMNLTQKEFSLLMLFVQRPGETMHAQYLYEKVWSRKMPSGDDSLTAAISQLKRKLCPSGATITAPAPGTYVFIKK